MAKRKMKEIALTAQEERDLMEKAGSDIERVVHETKAEYDVVYAELVGLERKKVGFHWNMGDRINKTVEKHGPKVKPLVVKALVAATQFDRSTVYQASNLRILLDQKELKRWLDAEIRMSTVNAVINAPDEKKQLATEMAFNGKDGNDIRKAVGTAGTKRAQGQSVKAKRQRQSKPIKVFEKLSKIAQDLSDQLGSAVEAMSRLDDLEAKDKKAAVSELKKALKELADLNSAVKEMQKKANKL